MLENFAKEGFPSRAEITDAAMSERAECVMLNKEAHVCEAVSVLDDILQEMQMNVTKKGSILRGLKLAERFSRRRRSDPRPVMAWYLISCRLCQLRRRSPDFETLIDARPA